MRNLLFATLFAIILPAHVIAASSDEERVPWKAFLIIQEGEHHYSDITEAYDVGTIPEELRADLEGEPYNLDLGDACLFVTKERKIAQDGADTLIEPEVSHIMRLGQEWTLEAREPNSSIQISCSPEGFAFIFFH